MPAIEISELSKTFARNGTRALKRVSLTIEEGEIVALIGASGSGKSTLLRHIGGLERGDNDGGAGRVAVFGETIQQGGRVTPKLRRIRAEIGFIFQQFNLVARVSVLTNVVIGALGRIPAWRGSLGLFSREEKLAAMRAMHRVGIARYATQRASTLSGGQQQRAAIARALVQGAKLILADEPIASLDPASANRVMATLSDINRTEHLTVLVSLHQVDYAIRYCPRTIAMRDGAIVFDGPSAQLTPEFLTELYGAESEELLLGPQSHSPRQHLRGDVLAGARRLAAAEA